jgi:predicted transcriptional regulator
MKIRDIVKEMNLTVIAGEKQLESEVTGVYICDLLSWVMSHSKKSDVWITVQNNVNIVAIASLLELACILIPEGVKVDDVTINKAEQNKVVIISSEQNSYELSVKLHELLNRP